MSARRPVSRARQVVETQELKSRDPRFDVLSGSVNKDLFRKSYSFLAEQHQQELETMRKTAAAARKNRQLPQEEKDRIDEALRRMENREVTRKNKDLQEEAMRQWKKEEADKRKEGKKAFFLKECMYSLSRGSGANS
jgi:ribosomal RNA-processing protein 36